MFDRVVSTSLSVVLSMRKFLLFGFEQPLINIEYAMFSLTKRLSDIWSYRRCSKHQNTVYTLYFNIRT